MFSEEESHSVTNSPIVSRRRLGSYSGDPPQLGIMKEDTGSPGLLHYIFCSNPTNEGTSLSVGSRFLFEQISHQLVVCAVVEVEFRRRKMKQL